jgi:hypothetical protein
MNDGGGENHSEYSDYSDDESKGPEKLVRKVPDFLFRFLAHVGRENRDERGRHGTLGNQTAKQVWDAVGKYIGVCGCSRAQEEGDALVPNVAENTADDGDQGDDRGRFEDALFIGQRAVLRGPNPNENNELTGKTHLT